MFLFCFLNPFIVTFNVSDLVPAFVSVIAATNGRPLNRPSFFPFALRYTLQNIGPFMVLYSTVGSVKTLLLVKNRFTSCRSWAVRSFGGSSELCVGSTRCHLFNRLKWNLRGSLRGTGKRSLITLLWFLKALTYDSMVPLLHYCEEPRFSKELMSLHWRLGVTLETPSTDVR